MPGQGYADFQQNPFRPGSAKKMPYFSDRLLIPRINQYLADNKDKMYVDINDMVNDLQHRYKEYSRRKRNAFRQVVEKAFSVVLQKCRMNDGGLGQQAHMSSGNSSSEVEECNVSDDNLELSANKQLVNLYKPSQLNAMAKQYQKCPNENAELIDLSSDDDNHKEDEEEEEEEEGRRKAGKGDGGEPKPRSNGLQKHVLKDTTLTLVQKNAGNKQGWKFTNKRVESPNVTVTRKRKVDGSIKYVPLSTLHKSANNNSSNTPGTSVTFANFAGNTKVLEEVCKLIFHMQHPEVYTQLGVSPPRGLLLHGPPGCGKTLLACAIAGELEVHFMRVSGPELVGGVSGESEERIRQLFDSAVECAPCVLFIDEIDSVTPNRQNAQREMERRIVAQLLSCMDGLNSKESGEQVLVIGATNRPDSLDPALRRAGRFDREVCLGIPNLKAREQILRVSCSNMKLAEDFDYELMAANTPGFVGADLVALAREAAMHAINRVFASMQHFKKDKRQRKAKKLKLDETATEDKDKGDVTSKAGDGGEGKTTDDESIVITDEVMEVDIIDSKDSEQEESEKIETKDQEESKKKETKDKDEKTDSQAKKGKGKGESKAGTGSKKEDKKEEVVEEEKGKKQKGDTTKEAVIDLEEKNKDSGVTEDSKDSGEAEKEDKSDKVEESGAADDSKDGSEAAKTADSSDAEKDKEKDKENGEGEKKGEETEVNEKEKTDNVDSDMEIAETGSEESAVCDKVASDDESEVEVLPDTGLTAEYNPPSLETLLSWLRDTPPLNHNQLQRVRITQSDFNRALKSVQPSAKREGFATVPDVTWDDVGSLQDIREELKMFILGPVKFRKQFEQLGLIAPTGILLCGPPGCGKTLLAKAVANEAGINFISVKGPELLNMYVGESERAVRQCFQRARNSAPCVIFFDELDSLCPRRSESGENGASMRVVNQMLTEMDGVEERRDVFLMAATNRPDIVDPAVLRPGRLDKIVYVGLPSQQDRLDILRTLTKNGSKPRLSEDVDLAQVAAHARCDGYTGADLAALVREAALQALKQVLSAATSTSTPEKEADGVDDAMVTATHFNTALRLIRPSVTVQERKRYEELRKQFTAAAD